MGCEVCSWEGCDRWGVKCVVGRGGVKCVVGRGVIGGMCSV